MKECREIRSLLSDALDGKIAPDQQEQIDQHLTHCPRCREASEELKRTVALLKGLEPVDPPPWLEGKIMARIAEEAAPRPSFWRRLLSSPIRTPLQAAAMIAICITGYYLARTTSPQVDLSAPAGRADRQTAGDDKKPGGAPSPAVEQAVPQAAKRSAAPSERSGKRDDVARPPDSLPSQPPKSSAPSHAEPEQTAPKREMAVPGGNAVVFGEKPAASKTDEATYSGSGTPSPLQEGVRDLELGAALTARPPYAPSPAPRPAPAPVDGFRGTTMREGLATTDGAHYAKKAKKAAPAKTFVITIAVNDPGSVVTVVTEMVREAGGLVTKSEPADGHGALTARIEASKLPDFLKKLVTIGKVQTKDLPEPDRTGPVLISIEWKRL